MFGFIARTVNGLARSVLGISNSNWGNAYNNPFGVGGIGSAKDSVWAIGGIEATAQALGSLPLLFVDENGNVIDRMSQEQKEWADTLRYPDQNLASVQVWELTSMKYDIDGVAFWLLIDANGKPIANPLEIPDTIQVYGPDNIKPVYQSLKSTVIIGWELRAGSLMVRLQLWQVVRFWKTNPYSYINGLKLTDKVGSTLALDRDAKNVNKGFFKRGGRPSGTLEASEKWDPSELKNWAQDFKEKYAGSENAGGIPVTPKGITFKASESTKDMDFRNLYAENRNEIFGATRVPKFKMGVTDDINRATADVLDSSWWVDIIAPKANVFCDIINNKLLYGTGMRLKFDFSSIPVLQTQLLDVEEKKLKLAARYWRLGYSLNMINTKLNLKMPVVNEKWARDPHDPSLLPSNAQPSGGDGEASTKLVSVEPSDFHYMARELSKSLSRAQEEKSDIDLAREGDEGAIERFILSIEKNTVDVYAPKMKVALDSYFDEMEKNQIEKLKAYFSGGSYLGKTNEKERELTVDKIDEVLFIKAVWNAKLINETSEFHLDSYIAAIKDVKKELGGFKVFVQSDVAAAREAAKVTSKITEINETVRKNITKAIAKQIELGGSQAEVVNSVKDAFDAEHKRTTMIARNETGNAVSKARWDALSVEVETKQWLSAKDDEVRETHKQYQKLKSVPVDYEYNIGLKYPHDLNGSAKEVIGCRCAIVRGK